MLVKFEIYLQLSYTTFKWWNYLIHLVTQSCIVQQESQSTGHPTLVVLCFFWTWRLIVSIASWDLTRLLHSTQLDEPKLLWEFVYHLVFYIIAPHIFINSFQFGQCVPYGSIMKWLVGRIYYWLSYAINFAIPFVLLSTMNSFIILTIRKSRQFTATASTNQGHGHDLDEGHGHKTKQFEKQTYIILFLVTFGFLILVTPSYLCFLYANVVDYQRSAKSFAEFYLFYHIAQKLFYTNFGINFYLYVISGQKFRKDLLNLFRIKMKTRADHNVLKFSQTQVTSVLSTDWLYFESQLGLLHRCEMRLIKDSYQRLAWIEFFLV